MCPRASDSEDEPMQTSYGVVWREGESPLATGKLELLPRGIRLEGLEGTQEISYELLANVRVGRLAGERIGGRPSVVLERRAGAPVTIVTVAKSSLVGEIVERLSALQLGDERPHRLAIVLPLKPESHEAVRALLAGGPPFDPAHMPGLERHEVFLTPQEAIFVFDSQPGEDALAPLAAEPELWPAAAAWGDHLAGPPRISENVYSWKRGREWDEL